MNDIAKLREEFDEKLFLAELENISETTLGIGKGLRFTSRNHAFIDVSNVEEASKVLNTYEQNGKRDIGLINYKNDMDYVLEVHRSKRDKETKLSIKYNSTGHEVYVDLPIIDSGLKEFFITGTRELEPYEQEYKNVREEIRYLRFKIGNIRVVAGYDHCGDEDYANRIVDYIKSR